MIHSHKLTSKNKRHKSFLEEERNDPITGDKIIEGNEIVLCGACKSAFLLDSWNYMASSHCNQPFTLKEIPTKQHLVKEIKIEKKYKLLLRDENISLKVIFSVLIMLFTFPILLSYIIIPISISQNLDVFLIALISFLLCVYSLAKTPKVRFSKLKVRISFPFSSKTIYLSEIEKLDFFASDKDNSILFLVIFLENGKIKRFTIIKDKHTISEIKELQEYFEENNLKDKVSFFLI